MYCTPNNYIIMTSSLQHVYVSSICVMVSLTTLTTAHCLTTMGTREKACTHSWQWDCTRRSWRRPGCWLDTGSCHGYRWAQDLWRAVWRPRRRWRAPGRVGGAGRSSSTLGCARCRQWRRMSGWPRSSLRWGWRRRGGWWTPPLWAL